jgi:hypothetical protein
MTDIKLFRMRIEEAKFLYLDLIYKEDHHTHIIAVECRKGEDKFSTDIMPLAPNELRFKFEQCLRVLETVKN